MERAKPLLLAALFVFVFPIFAHAATYFSGEITGDIVWTKEAGPYVVGSVTIPADASLTIEPGTIVKMRGSAESAPMMVYGTLTVGSADATEFVVITSIKDDSVGGDTNEDGNATTPASGDWRGISVESGGRATIARAVVRYGGAYTGYDYGCVGGVGYCGYQYFASSQLFTHGGTLTVVSASFDHTLFTHIEQSSGSSTIAASDLIGAPFAVLAGNGTLSLLRNHFFANPRGFFVTRTALALASNIFIDTPVNDLNVNASYFSDGKNMTGTASVPGTTMLRVGGTIDGRSFTLPRDGFIYVLAGLNIAPTGALTIAPGAIVKMHPGTQFPVYGSLTLGDSASPLWTLVTSYNDDSAGDTNGDGTDTTPARGDWGNITAEAGGRVSIARTAFRYGGARAGYDHICQAYCGPTYFTNSQLVNHGGTLRVNDGRFTQAPSHIDMKGGTTDIARADFTGATGGALLVGAGSLTMDGSSIHDLAFGTNGLFVQNGASATAIGNWWGSATGPQHTGNASGTGVVINGDVAYTPWLTEAPDLEAPALTALPSTTTPKHLATTTPANFCTINCNSNVLFLPGLQASRLYRPDYDGGTDRLWEPNGNADVRDLYLDLAGNSFRSDIYTTEVIDEIFGISPDIYKTFIAMMDEMKSEEVINDWSPIPYDWRLSIDDILGNGRNIDGRIYYSGDLAATTTPYVLQELKRLAASSRTGKVTIIAHSNGGLVAKALMVRLEAMGKAGLVDKVVLLAAPQLGTPKAIASLLHGEDQEYLGGMIMNKPTARELAKNMPGAYQLLPSAGYFGVVDDPSIIIRNTASTQTLFNAYGTSTESVEELYALLRGDEGRISASFEDVESPNNLNGSLITKAKDLHAIIDGWTPSAGIEVIEIAGWGLDTVRGIRYSERRIDDCTAGLCRRLTYTPLFTDDGDETVVVPSALATASSTRYWVDLRQANQDLRENWKHADILEAQPIKELLSFLITDATQILPDYVATSPPTSITKKFRYTLHSPLSLGVRDSQGRYTGLASTTISGVDYPLVSEEIPNSYYMEFGETKIVGFEEGSTTVSMTGEALGVFTLEGERIEGGVIVGTTTFPEIPVATGTVVTLLQPVGALSQSLLIDFDGNGSTDIQVNEDGFGEIDAVALLRGMATTLELDAKSEKKLLAAVDRFERVVKKEFRDSERKIARVDQVLDRIVEVVEDLARKGAITADDKNELLRFVDIVREVVVQ